MGIITKSTNKYQTCIDQCNRCYQACHECITQCLREEDVAQRDELIINLMECAEICNDASRFMAMEARRTKDICELCMNICNECAHMCSMFKDDHCVQCAEECKKCANECKSIS